MRRRRKTSTKEKIIKSARKLFSEKWYDTVSVAEICRNARVSNGVYYNYFRDKKTLFEFFLNELIEKMEVELSQISGNSKKDKISSFIDIVFKLSAKDTELVTIFREGQYKFPEYEKKLKNIYINTLSNILERDISDVEYIFIVGGLRFLSVMAAYNWFNINKESFKDIVFNGIFDERINRKERIFNVKFINERSKKLDSKERIVEAGIELFGTYGFHNVNVYDITKLAGFAVGTFYIYFDSKETFLREIVRNISHETRKFISRNLSVSLNRLEQELQGTYLFLKFFERNKNYYEIVRESEFVAKEEVIKYYDAFRKGYLKNLSSVKLEDKETIALTLMGISHFIGIEYLFHQSILDINNFLIKLSHYLENGLKLEGDLNVLVQEKE